MTATLTFNPSVTTNALGSFNITTNGYMQGVAQDQPSVRNSLSGGFLAPTETLPMWGGVAIAENLATPSVTTPNQALGNSIVRATSVASTVPITGFSVFDQVHSAINSPQSPVPLIPSYGMVNFYRIGSRARIPVACDASLATLEGGLINANVSWNFGGNFLQVYDASTATVAISTMVWSATNGGQIAIVTSAATTTVAAIGDIVNITLATTTGTGGNSAVNGTFTVNTFTDNQHFTVSAPGTSGYYGTITASSALINEGTVALNTIGIEVIDIQIGNSMTVNYNLATGFATWNMNGSTALLLI
jgi:hypothetical protein